jgi:hypothetical protein
MTQHVDYHRPKTGVADILQITLNHDTILLMLGNDMERESLA